MRRSAAARALALIAVCVFVVSAGGCSVVRTFAGANIDAERFEKAREAAMWRVRGDAAATLATRLASGPVDDADIFVTLSDALVNKAAKQVIGCQGWIDASTDYTITSVDVSLTNGAAIASLGLIARSTAWSVDVKLMMDCVLTFSMEKDALVSRLEPFNIAPDVRAGGMLTGMGDIIRDVIKVKVSRLGQDLPPMTYPVDVTNTLPIAAARIPIRGPVNLTLDSPARLMSVRLRMKEVLIFDKKAVLALNLAQAEVK
ncbi:MAG: hypothetical protein IPP94_02830 [Ignavibacteria bacterium]|nr:hypothetical protein [Ignavibacteria bacterium]